MYPLSCSVQKYGWGKRGHESKVALYKNAQDPSFQVVENEPYAELWMGNLRSFIFTRKLAYHIKNFILLGTHPNGPSSVHKGAKTLKDYLVEKEDSAIGPLISKHFYTAEHQGILAKGDLPFLFKVLSINQALSIQAHPNRSLARELRARDPKNYPDSNHKPEMLIAISDSFEAMCGFRPYTDIYKHFLDYPELVNLCQALNCDRFSALSTATAAEQEAALKECFSAMMNTEPDVVTKEFNALKSRLEAKDEVTHDYLQGLFLRLAKTYPNDVGCFSIFLLNCLVLKKGEAIYLAANIPHAYLLGDGVECMACSDNVGEFISLTIFLNLIQFTVNALIAAVQPGVGQCPMPVRSFF